MRAVLSRAERPQRTASLWTQDLLLLAAIFVVIMLLHAPLLRLPYFWDEAGYYIPAARDLYLTGTLIPHSTPSNAHPPLVLAWLALVWRVAGYSPLVTRTAMLVVAAFSLFGLFRLARFAANLPVAWATTALTALYPAFFTQSSLAHLDMAAAGFTFWGLLAYLEDRRWKHALWFSLAAGGQKGGHLSKDGGGGRPAWPAEEALNHRAARKESRRATPGGAACIIRGARRSRCSGSRT